jgi:PPOX class probable F420-dependent enzyme
MANPKIPEQFLDLFQTRAFAHFVTLMADGTPQVTPVWVDYDGDYVLVNTARGRQKERNVRRNPHVALCIIDPSNAYRYLQVRGTVVEITAEGAEVHIDKMAKKYQGLDVYPNHSPDWPRVLLKIKPEHTSGSAR